MECITCDRIIVRVEAIKMGITTKLSQLKLYIFHFDNHESYEDQVLK